MGRAFKNTLPTNIAAWLIAAAVLAINGFLLFDFVAKDLPTNAAARTGFLACVASLPAAGHLLCCWASEVTRLPPTSFLMSVSLVHALISE